MRKSAIWVLGWTVLILVVGCSGREGTATELTSPTLPADGSEPDSAPVCPPARGDGTVPPVVSIDSITFVVNGVEQVVGAGDTLQVSPGDEMVVSEVAICVGAFSGSGGDVCADFAPVAADGQEIMADHGGTHLIRLVAGSATIAGPDYVWTVGEDWQAFRVMLNHWTPRDTEDVECANRRCEHDDLFVIPLP